MGSSVLCNPFGVVKKVLLTQGRRQPFRADSQPWALKYCPVGALLKMFDNDVCVNNRALVVLEGNEFLRGFLPSFQEST